MSLWEGREVESRWQVGVEVWLLDSQAKTVEVLKLQGNKYRVEALLAGDQVLTSNLFPGWRLPLRDLFDFRGRF